MTYKQPDIDLMYWQYCMGVLEVANQFENVSLDLVNALGRSRFEHLEKAFHMPPSFRVSFERHLTHFSIKKVAL